jgi:hypothetical protein
MELYLRWLDQNERRVEHEEAPIGLILCSGKNQEQVELLQLRQGEIRVAEYLTALPAKSVLAAKLHDAVIRVQEQMARRGRSQRAQDYRLPRLRLSFVREKRPGPGSSRWPNSGKRKRTGTPLGLRYDP